MLFLVNTKNIKEKGKKSIFVFFPKCTLAAYCSVFTVAASGAEVQINESESEGQIATFGKEPVPSKVRTSLLCSPGTPLTLCNDLYENFDLVQSPSPV